MFSPTFRRVRESIDFIWKFTTDFAEIFFAAMIFQVQWKMQYIPKYSLLVLGNNDLFAYILVNTRY